MVLVIATISACATQREDMPGPDVYWRSGYRADRDWTTDELNVLQDGADRWRAACFNVHLEGDEPDAGHGEYGVDWFSFRVVRDHKLLGTDILGQARAWKGEIVVNPKLQGVDLQAVATHEFGHMLANDTTHLELPNGVMYAVFGRDRNTLTDADFDWLCATGGWCERCDR